MQKLIAARHKRLSLLALDHVQHALLAVAAAESARVVRFFREAVAGSPNTVKQRTPVIYSQPLRWGRRVQCRRRPILASTRAYLKYAGTDD